MTFFDLVCWLSVWNSFSEVWGHNFLGWVLAERDGMTSNAAAKTAQIIQSFPGASLSLNPWLLLLRPFRAGKILRLDFQPNSTAVYQDVFSKYEDLII